MIESEKSFPFSLYLSFSDTGTPHPLLSLNEIDTLECLGLLPLSFSVIWSHMEWHREDAES